MMAFPSYSRFFEKYPSYFSPFFLFIFFPLLLFEKISFKFKEAIFSHHFCSSFYEVSSSFVLAVNVLGCSPFLVSALLQDCFLCWDRIMFDVIFMPKEFGVEGFLEIFQTAVNHETLYQFLKTYT